MGRNGRGTFYFHYFKKSMRFLQWLEGVKEFYNNFDFWRIEVVGIERSNNIESNNFGRKSCQVSGEERIRYSGCFITLKIEGNNSGPTKSSCFMGIPVLRGSGLEGFYCILKVDATVSLKKYRFRWNCVYIKNIMLFNETPNKNETLPGYLFIRYQRCHIMNIFTIFIDFFVGMKS